ncbi:hypothetical protein Clacol_006824 [Clathrus columnatus]|uniref:Uncharacterized protein n=1 Tax=Clathrus columnatus TaxID=1419009 RepID=A0AAV5AI08_9AGAM|nr:hypothetical protein Clacol_006824 [Clathrus columnatus]
MDELDQFEQSHAMGLYHRRLIHFHDVFSDPGVCLFDQAGAPLGGGETHGLKTTLIEATEIWEKLTGEVAFEPEDLRKNEGAERKAASSRRDRDLGVQQTLRDGHDPRRAAKVEGVEGDPQGGSSG